MSDPVENFQHVKEGLAKLLTQFKGLPNFAALLTSYLTQIQELETVYFELLIERRLDNAVGAQLDGIGRIVDLPRAGRTDEAYRTAIRGQISVLKLNSRIEDILLVVTLSLPGATVEIIEFQPAAIEVHVTSAISLDIGEAVAQAVNNAKGGGVQMRFYWLEATPFAYSPTGVLIPSSPNGYGAGAYTSVSTGEI